jgi:hypothetical protein
MKKSVNADINRSLTKRNIKFINQNIASIISLAQKYFIEVIFLAEKSN